MLEKAVAHHLIGAVYSGWTENGRRRRTVLGIGPGVSEAAEDARKKVVELSGRPLLPGELKFFEIGHGETVVQWASGREITHEPPES